MAQRMGLQQSISTMIEGSPRLRTIQTLGYTFIQNPVKWNGAYKSEKHAVVGLVDVSSPKRFNGVPAEYEDFVQQSTPYLQHWLHQRRQGPLPLAYNYTQLGFSKS